jgi:hypothetical protein
MIGHATASTPKGLRLATMADVDWLWERVKTQHSIFLEPTKDDSVRFAELLGHPASHSFIVDEGGLIFLSDVEPGNMGFFNGIVWDEKLYGQTARAKEILAFLFKLLGLRRVSAVVPEDNKLARKYVEKMGFKKEAQFRKAIRRPDGPIDMFVYGLLREEVVTDGLGRSSSVHRGRSWIYRLWPRKSQGGTSKPDTERARPNAEGRAELPSGGHSGSVATGNGRIKGLLGFAWAKWSWPW